METTTPPIDSNRKMWDPEKHRGMGEVGLAWGGRAAADAEILIWRGMGLQVTSGNRNAAHRFKWEDVEPGENRRGVEGRGAG